MARCSPPFRSLPILVALTVILLNAPLAVADTKLVDLNTMLPFVPFTTDNPCTPAPEIIVFEGFSHLHVQMFLTDTATLRFKRQSNSHAMGKDAAGLMYVASSESHSDFTVPSSVTSVTERTQSRVISQGPQDNFFIIIKTTFDVATGTPTIEIEPECRG
jgi:hypothetical protein